MFLDWLLVFPLKMGMTGAAVATVIGTGIQVCILCSLFFRRKCGLKLVKPERLPTAFKEILQVGMGAAVLDSGNTVLAIMMNNQIMHYGSATELAVYGVVAIVSSLFQALFNGVGQAIQPLVSVNFGAGRTERVERFWRMSLRTVLVLGFVFLQIGELVPEAMIRLFIHVTPEVLTAAPNIVRLYSLLFLPLGISVLAIYYLQSTMHDKMSMIVAVLRSIALSGMMIYLLPLLFGVTGIWIALPLSEVIVAGFVFRYIRKKVNS